MHPLQRKIFREMAPGKKLEVAERLFFSAWELKKASVSKQHPQWTEDQINKKVRELFLYARS